MRGRPPEQEDLTDEELRVLMVRKLDPAALTWGTTRTYVNEMGVEVTPKQYWLSGVEVTHVIESLMMKRQLVEPEIMDLLDRWDS